MKSAQVKVLAGAWITMLQGITIGPWFSVKVPPKRCGSVVLGQFALVVSTVALWMKPVSSNPWIWAASAPSTLGSGSVGVIKGAIAPGGGLTGLPWANELTL